MKNAARVVVVDYGVNNIGSVVSMLRRIGIVPVPTTSPAALSDADAIVLPGIGAFDVGVGNLRDAGFFEALQDRVANGTPILGICLGMQLLTKGSEEGKREGLGLIDAFTRKLPSAPPLKIPHMGWTDTAGKDREWFGGLGDDARFYFVHSYHVVCADPADIAAEAQHGIPFTAALRRGRVFGTQFHPEKSHRFGLEVLRRFVELATHA